ncbi:MAG: excinuclease ABC subunit UvrA, partial [Muribaculaceae bacterium]|nr:excinuclease ABC subunit UvrA [Muribaculaceae bacterium]
NSPQGACPTCKGIGTVNIIDRDKIIPDDKISIAAGAIVPLGKKKNSVIFWQIEAILKYYGADLDTPVSQVPPEALEEILHGTTRQIKIENATLSTTNYFQSYDGIVKYIELQAQDDDASEAARKWSDQFYSRATCPDCNGDRLNREALHFFIGDDNIADLSRLDISALKERVDAIPSKLDPSGRIIATEIIKEISARLQFLLDVGLKYLSLNRSSATLSGGESQRIRLATQLGSELVNVLYILDEPSIGLHQRDNDRLINSLKRLRDASNSIIVVEHDRDMMTQADYIVDIGPGAGRAGGHVVFQGTPEQMLKTDTVTARYLNGSKAIIPNYTPRSGNGKTIELLGATGHNLKNVDLRIDLGTLTVVSGVSGSGKSSLINSTLKPILSAHFYRSLQQPLPYREIRGMENIDKVVTVDQQPLGRTPRSNPATYTGVFTDIR